MKRALRATTVVGAVLIVAAALISCGQSSSKTGAASSTQPAADKLQDGTYMATYSHTDSHSWQEFLQVKVQGNKITAARFDAIDAKGNLKTNDANYNATMKKVSGSNPDEYTKALSQALLTGQAAPVDGVTGATESSKDFNDLAALIIAAAKKGDSAPIILPQDGTYTAKGKASQYGWIPYLEITFANDQMTKVAVDQVKMDNNKITARQSEDKTFQEQYKKTTGKDITDAFNTLDSELLKTGDPSKVDVVSSATEISNQFKDLAKQILDSRVSLSPDTISQKISSNG